MLSQSFRIIFNYKSISIKFIPIILTHQPVMSACLDEQHEFQLVELCIYLILDFSLLNS